MPGKTISLYIMDDDSRNLMTAELGQWTGKAYIGDRRHLGIVSAGANLSKFLLMKYKCIRRK